MRQRRRQRQRLSLAKVSILIVVVSFILAVLIHIQQSGNNDVVDVIAPQQDNNDQEDNNDYEQSSIVMVASDSFYNTGYLKLVNRHYYITQPVNRSHIVTAHPTVPVRAIYITIHNTALNAIANLFYEGRYIANFFVTSGYREFDRQEYLYANAVDRAYVLPPGHSEHQLGLAADILIPGVGMSEMSGRPETIWLSENAWRHGLILRYPRDAIDITGVAYEPWHFRYVGLVHAWYMTSNNLVLEEYLSFLAETGGFTTTINGTVYHVIYQQPINGQINVPRDLNFTVSSSNRGGYIITASE